MTWRLVKAMLGWVLLLVGMCIKVAVVLVCALLVVMSFLAHFVGGLRG